MLGCDVTQEFKRQDDASRTQHGLRVYHSFIKPGCRWPINLPKSHAEKIREQLQECLTSEPSKDIPLAIFDASASAAASLAPAAPCLCHRVFVSHTRVVGHHSRPQGDAFALPLPQVTLSSR